MSIVFVVANKRGSSSVEQGVAGSKYFTDCTVSIQHQFNNSITEYRVETGVNGSDHIQVQSDTFTVAGVFSQHSLDRYAGDTLAYVNRVTEAYKFLKGLRDNRTIFTLVSKYDVYTDCAIESLSIPTTVEMSSNLYFDMTIKRIRRASVTSATITPLNVKDSKKDDAAGTGNGGRKTKEEIERSQLKYLSRFIGSSVSGAEPELTPEEQKQGIPYQLGRERND